MRRCVDDNALLTAQEAAESLGASTKSILRAISSGRLRAARPGKSYLIKGAWLNEFLDGQASGKEGNCDD